MNKMYAVTLKTLAPVFIGSGTTLKNNQYVYDKKKQTVKIVDEIKLIKVLQEQKAFGSFSAEQSQGRLRELKEFLAKKGIDEDAVASRVLEIKPLTNREKPMNYLHLFIRGGDNRAYIPGSSLKGALRTCLLSRSSEDTDNNIFRHLLISDSNLVADSDFAIYQKIDYSKIEKGMPVYRECIKPNVEVKFTLMINTDSAGKEVIDLAKIKNAIQDTFKSYHTWAGAVRKNLNHGNEHNRHIIYLGGGAGFVSKTLHYKEKDVATAREDIKAIFMKNQQFEKVYGQINDPNANIPLAIKLAPVAYKTFSEMGKCELFFEEVQL